MPSASAFGAVVSFLGEMAVTFCVTFTFVNSVGSVSIVRGRSMLPTLEGGEAPFGADLVLVSSLAKRKCHPGDIVVCRSPISPSVYLVKRLIAEPEDVVQNIANGELVAIPPGHCWIEGDNVFESGDSTQFGPVPQGLLVGKVYAVLWPPSRLQWLTHQPVADVPHSFRVPKRNH
jgi:mitochondrial inner membrane protease subunit 2